MNTELIERLRRGQQYTEGVDSYELQDMTNIMDEAALDAPTDECKACTELRNIADPKRHCQAIRMQSLPDDMRKIMERNISELYDDDESQDWSS